MKEIVAKHVSAVVLGDSHSSKLIYNLLRSRVKNSVLLGSQDRFRFLRPGLVSINGVKTSVSKIVIEKTLSPVIPAINGIAASPKEAPITGSKSALIVGAGRSGVMEAIERLRNTPKVTLVDTADTILSKYDSSVQEVLLRYLKKHKVRVLTGTNVLSIVTKDALSYVVAEQKGSPKRFVSDSVTIKCGFAWNDHDEYGLNNLAGEEKIIKVLSSSCSEFITKDVLILPHNPSVTMDDADQIVKFLSGKKTHISLRSVHSSIGLAAGICFFSFGILEQHMPNAHTGYKKATVKLRNTTENTPTFFIKIISTIGGEILGISGVVPQHSFDISYLEFVVKTRSKAQEIKKFIQLTSPHAESLHEAIDSL